MGVYGNIHGAFNGLGKPSIKLEFEDNESLVAFSKKMQDEEPASVQWNEEEEMFTPVEGYGDKYIVTDLRQRAKKEPGEVKSLTKFQFSKFKNAPELFEPVMSVSPSLFSVYPVYRGINNGIVYFGKEFSDDYNADFILKDYVVNKSEGLVTLNFARYKAYGTDGVSIVSVWSFSISCPVCNIITAYGSKIDAYFGLIEFAEGLIAVLKNAQSKLRSNSKDYKTLQHQIERWQTAANQYADSLGAPGDTYIITDTRTRARKDLEDTAALKKYDIRKFSGEELQKMQTDDPLLYEQIKSDINTPTTAATGIKDIIKICREKVGKSSILFHSEPDVWNLRLTVRDKKVFIILNYNDTDSNKIKQSITFNFANLDPKIFWSVNADEVSKLADLIKVEPLKWFITSFYPRLNDVIDYSFDFSAKDLKKIDLLYLCDTNDGEWWNYGFIASIGIDEFTNILGDKIRTLYAQGEDKYDDVLLLYDVCLYIISDGERGADFEQVEQPIPEITGASYSHDGFYAVKILNSHGLKSEITASYSDLGKTANNTLYNNLDILDFRGMQPTYRQLSNYDAFFKPAANKNSLKGWGLNDTKKLIADICRNHYKECAAIAKHLKAETKLQSAFNLWHWLHHNIRYEYDREGREEVRTPARVWADRHRGVDCDCLSVLAWCVLKCMGYNPAFELAAFRNKPAYSHIYINLDGIVVDRVWYVFNSRPPFITKTELFKVGMLDNLGQLF